MRWIVITDKTGMGVRYRESDPTDVTEPAAGPVQQGGTSVELDIKRGNSSWQQCRAAAALLASTPRTMCPRSLLVAAA